MQQGNKAKKTFSAGVMISTLLVMVTLAVFIAGLWLVIARGPGAENSDWVREKSQSQSLSGFLTRGTTVTFKDTGEMIDLSVLYASPTYFTKSNQREEGIKYDVDHYVLFYVAESAHIHYLPEKPFKPVLNIDGKAFVPLDYQILSASTHHRNVLWRFAAVDEQGKPLLTAAKQTMKLVLAPDQIGKAQWNLPLNYPSNTATHFSLGLLLAAVAGLLTVLTPCLMQLTLFYLTTVTNLSMREVQEGKMDLRARRALMKSSMFFVIGFTVIYTTAGALAGFMGATIQKWFAHWNEWSRPILVIAGIGIILFAIYSAAKANAPLVCKIPLLKPKPGERKQSRLGSLMMGILYGLGCASCFGGALFATLLIYIGSTGSVFQGAIILLSFSLAVGIPFLLASWFISTSLRFMEKLQMIAPYIALITSLIMIAFGFLLISNQFHYVSGLLYRFFP